MARRRLTAEEVAAYAEVGRALRRLEAVEHRIAMRRDGGPPRCGRCRRLCEGPVLRDTHGVVRCVDCAESMPRGDA